MEIPSTLMWQIFKVGPKYRKCWFELEFSFKQERANEDGYQLHSSSGTKQQTIDSF
jgi:hypothetical protein